jgi:hypothetical protein
MYFLVKNTLKNNRNIILIYFLIKKYFKKQLKLHFQTQYSLSNKNKLIFKPYN